MYKTHFHNQECAEEIGNVTVGDVESGLAALDCFEVKLKATYLKVLGHKMNFV